MATDLGDPQSPLFDPWKNPELNTDPRFPAKRPMGLGAEGVPDQPLDPQGRPMGMDPQSWYFLHKFGMEHPRQAGLPQGPEQWAADQAKGIGAWQAGEQYGVDDYRSRGKNLLETLAARMRGEGLEATRQGQMARAGSRSDLLSQMASRGNNAAGRRDAQFGIASSSQAIRAQEAAAAEAEKQAARDQYGAELNRQWASESQDAGRKQDFLLGREQARQGMLGMGMDDIAARYGQYEDYLRGQGANLLARKKLVAQKQAEEDAAQGAAIDTGASILTLGLSKLSDERCKENIKPARGEARALLQALKQAEEDEALGAELGARPGRDVSRAMGSGPKWSRGAALQKQKDSGESPALLAALREEGPTSWSYKSGQGLDGKKRMGTMAQTVERAVPGVVTTDGKGRKALKVPELVAAYAGLFAEQQKQIEELQRRVSRGGPSGAAGMALESSKRQMQEGSFLPSRVQVLGAAPSGRGEPIGAAFEPSTYESAETRGISRFEPAEERQWAPPRMARDGGRLPPADVLGMTGGADPKFGLVARRR